MWREKENLRRRRWWVVEWVCRKKRARQICMPTKFLSSNGGSKSSYHDKINAIWQEISNRQQGVFSFIFSLSPKKIITFRINLAADIKLEHTIFPCSCSLSLSSPEKSKNENWVSVECLSNGNFISFCQTREKVSQLLAKMPWAHCHILPHLMYSKISSLCLSFSAFASEGKIFSQLHYLRLSLPAQLGFSFQNKFRWFHYKQFFFLFSSRYFVYFLLLLALRLTEFNF
jgi:hypothetical protein